MNHNRKIIYLAGFLFSIPVALTSYINSSFLEAYADRYHVGIIYIIASVITIVGMLEMPRLLSRLGNRFTILLSSAFIFLSFVILALVKSGTAVIPAFILYFLATNFIIASLDIFMEDFSGTKKIGRFRGFYLSVTSLAWVVAQMISGSVIEKSSFTGIYLLSALFIVLVGFIFIFFLKDFVDPRYRKITVLKTIKSFARNGHLLRIYIINLILKFFFAWMIIYTPIYLHQYIGFNWSQIGEIFTIMLLPFVFIEFPLGKLSDKIGEKKLLLSGFVICTLFTLIIPFLSISSFALWAGVLFMTRIGAATIEAMSESYFFKSVKEEDDDTISFFRNTGPLSFIVGPLVAIPVFIFVPHFQYLFFALGVVLLLGLFISLRLRDVR